jgi:hypothetical protein
MGHVVRLFAVLLLACIVASPATAERRDWTGYRPPPPVIQKLMGEPVSLLDWGLLRLERQLEQAGAVLVARRESRGPVVSGAAYSWRTQNITGFISIATPRDERSQIRCAEIHRQVVRLITTGAPDGVAPETWYVQNLFAPLTRPWLRPHRREVTALMGLVRVEVTLRDVDFDTFEGDHTAVVCSGPLDAAPDRLHYRKTS